MRFFKKSLLIISLIFVLVFLLALVDVSVLASDSERKTYEYNNHISEDMLENIARNCEFSNNRIIVVLKREYSTIDNKYSKDDFPDINLSSVELLTKGVETVIKQGDESNEMFDESSYQAILCLTLNASSKEDVLRTINVLNKMEEIESAEPDLVLHKEVVNPNDPYFKNNKQWGLNGTAGINCPSAWEINSGSNSVKVGVIDTGIKANHPDLVNRVNVSLSRDFSIGSPYIPSTVTDSDGHGTHVAGIIGAEGNNGIGITGVCQDVQLVSLAIQPTDLGDSFATQLIMAVDYAIEKGIKILNNSNGTSNYTGTVTSRNAMETILRAYPGLFVTSAGNDGNDNDLNSDRFPSNIRLPNLITIGSHDKNNRRSSFSNFGHNNVDIFAPGRDIISTYIDNKYVSLSGTSMATPHVTGVAALLLSQYPNLSGAAIKEIIMNSAEIVLDKNGNSVFGNLCVSGGKLSAYNALNGYKTIEKGTNTNIKSNLHNGKGLFGFHQLGSGFVEITMQAIKNSGSASYPQGSFRVLNDKGEVIRKCEINNFTDEAINRDNQKSLTTFLPKSGYYYIDLDYDEPNIALLRLLVKNVHHSLPDLDLFDFDQNQEFTKGLISNGQPGDCIRSIRIKQSSKYDLIITTTGSARLVVLKKEVINSSEELIVYKNKLINGNTTLPINLSAGLYYIGYFDLSDNSTASIALKRRVTHFDNRALVSDPKNAALHGSQITVAERDIALDDRSYEGTRILEGFTRLIYLDGDYAPSVSRLDYDWYSSNEDVATVSAFGTVLAQNVAQNTTVKIMAVYRNDMSKVYIKEFIIVNDIETYASSPIDIEITMNVSAGEYTSINFGNTPVPINILQYYYWSSSNESYATVDSWGRIYCYYSSVGETVEITGIYMYNSRVKIKITVNIVN